MKIKKVRNRFNDLVEDAILKDANFSILEMARQIGTDKNTLYALTAKPDSSVQMPTLTKILNYFDVPLTDFFNVVYDDNADDSNIS